MTILFLNERNQRIFLGGDGVSFYPGYGHPGYGQMITEEMKQRNRAEKCIKIAVVEDVHDQWEAADNEAIAHLGVDLVL